MSVTLYDRAITDKIKGWVTDVNTTVLSPEETTQMFRIVADKNFDRPINLPLITIKRGRDIDLDLTAKRTISFQGKVFNNKNGISDHLNAVPIKLSYFINIYARELEQVDEYVRNFIFYIINYSRVRILIPYNNCNFHYDSFMRLDDSISDNSDIPERLVPGQFSRFTIPIRIDDACLFSYNHRSVPKVTQLDIKSVNRDIDVAALNCMDILPNTQQQSELAEDIEKIELIKE